jgi:hypothetical protein
MYEAVNVRGAQRFAPPVAATAIKFKFIFQSFLETFEK